MLANIGTAEITIIAVIIMILFAGQKVPELIQGFIEAIREFRRPSTDSK